MYGHDRADGFFDAGDCKRLHAEKAVVVATRQSKSTAMGLALAADVSFRRICG